MTNNENVKRGKHGILFSLNAGPVVGGLVDVAVEDLCGELVPEGAVGAPQLLHRRPEAEQVVLALVLQEGVEAAPSQRRAHHGAERYHGGGAHDVGKVDALARAEDGREWNSRFVSIDNFSTVSRVTPQNKFVSERLCETRIVSLRWPYEKNHTTFK